VDLQSTELLGDTPNVLIVHL
jgi:Ubiquitin carboxyl-terminal hydrolase